MKKPSLVRQPLTQEQAFIRAICEDPFDDTSRLVYADWLEEDGRAERAELIRVQVEWERDFAHTYMAGAGCERWQQRREYVSQRLWALAGSHPFPSQDLPDVLHWCRGFAEEVALPLRRFLREAKTLFGSLPLLRVRLTDRNPRPTRYVHVDTSYPCAWWRGTQGVFAEGIPLQLFRLLTGGQSWTLSIRTYATKQAAELDLSAACVTYGRQKAGLPPLPAGT